MITVLAGNTRSEFGKAFGRLARTRLNVTCVCVLSPASGW